jgi:hypothetical protein
MIRRWLETVYCQRIFSFFSSLGGTWMEKSEEKKDKKIEKGISLELGRSP